MGGGGCQGWLIIECLEDWQWDLRKKRQSILSSSLGKDLL